MKGIDGKINMEMELKPTTNPKPNNYRTSDLYLSSFLMARGSRLRAVNESSGQKYFVFEAENIESLLGDYFNNAKIPVLSYKAALRDLRTIIHNGFLAGNQNCRG